MIGELLGALIDAAAGSCDNEENNKTARLQSQTQLEIERERTRQNKEETKRQIIGGVFAFLTACASSDSNSKNNSKY